MGFMGGIFMLFWGVLLIGGIVLAVVFLVRYLQGTHQPRAQQLYGQAGNTQHTQGGSVALNILDERFARGEISEDEYATKKRAILMK